MYRIIDRKGVLHWIEENSNIKRDTAGNPTGMGGVIRDVTDRVWVEEALCQNRERLDNILRASLEVVFETDPGGHLVFASDLWERLIGYPFETMKGPHYSDVLHPDDRDRVSQDMKAYDWATGPVGNERRIIRPDGSVVWVFGQSVAVFNPDGYTRGCVGTITDITQRKKMEEALAENEERYRALTENTGDILVAVDMTGGFT